ncbi:acyl-coenzyme A synthetase/AMP-(fatty) acid ligase [Paraburkholderia sp. CI3]
MPAEAPLFLMYSSGTMGRPKGCQHSIGGYLAYVAWTSKYIQDIHPEDVYWCMADIGWITGHSYIVYGPLALAASSVVYEGVPVYPDAGRPWRIAENLGVNIFHTSPTAIRALRRSGPDEPAKYGYHFKHMTTVGEPIEPEVWKWYHRSVGKGEAVIVDTWWQTETGGFHCSTVPALHKMKPGSAGPGIPGIHPVIYDDAGNELASGSGKAGNICILNPWPGAFQTIWRAPERYVKTYYARYCRDPRSKDWRDWPYMAGDGAVDAADGYFRILGRIDDVINVAGHRLGTRPSPRYQRNRVSRPACPRSRRSGCRAGRRRDQGQSARTVCFVKARGGSLGGACKAGHKLGGRSDRSHREAAPGGHCSGHAQDPVGQDHAARARSTFKPSRPRRRIHAG